MRTQGLLSALVFALWVAVAPARAGDILAAEGCAVSPKFEAPRDAIQKCTALLRRADLSNGDRAEALKNRARNERWLDLMDQAAIDYEEAIKFAPNDAELHWRLGWIATDRGNLTYAATLVDQALALQPNSADAYDLKGAIASRTGDMALAKSAYDKAVALEPDKVMWRHNRALFFTRIGAQREALAELDELLRLNLKELDTAESHVKGKAVTYRARVQVDRANMLDKMGRTAEAEKALDQFVAADPGAVSYGYRGWHYFERDDFAKAASDLDKALTYDRNFWILYELRGWVFGYTNQYAEAVAAFSIALQLNPTTGSSYWGRAVSLRELNKQDEALKDAKMAITSDATFRMRKLNGLAKRGYFEAEHDGSFTREAAYDAVTACMIDKGCM
ncbi:MAG: tetratricopeptide repeat protein [Pseudolabrys sp.]|jgi:tetratricopeptide (TPR) repeat protein